MKTVQILPFIKGSRLHKHIGAFQTQTKPMPFPNTCTLTPDTELYVYIEPKNLQETLLGRVLPTQRDFHTGAMIPVIRSGRQPSMWELKSVEHQLSDYQVGEQPRFHAQHQGQPKDTVPETDHLLTHVSWHEPTEVLRVDARGALRSTFRYSHNHPRCILISLEYETGT